MSASTARRSMAASVTVATLVLVLAGAELGARALQDRLPVPLLWHSQEAFVRVEQMEAAESVDIVLAGASLAAVGLSPDVLEQRLGDVSAYNAGLSAGQPSLSAPWTMKVVVPLLDPDVLVIGVGSFDFHDHASAVDFRDAFERSPGGRHVLAPNDLVAAMDWWLSDHSVLWAHRRQLRDPQLLVDAVRGSAEVLDPLAAAVGPSGWATYEGTPRFDPAAPDAQTGLPVQEWSLGTHQRQVLRGWIQEARDRGITVVLALMPVTDFVIDAHPNGQLDHEQYVEAATQLADSLSIPLLRYDHIRDPRLFGDAVHLNREGASHLTSELATDLARLEIP